MRKFTCVYCGKIEEVHKDIPAAYVDAISVCKACSQTKTNEEQEHRMKVLETLLLGFATLADGINTLVEAQEEAQTSTETLMIARQKKLNGG